MSEATAPMREGFRERFTAPDSDAFIFGQDDLDALFPLMITLPDGRIVAIDALVAAVTAGSPSVPATEGSAVSVEFLIDLLTKAFGKVGTSGDTMEGDDDGQASFRDGMNLVMLNSLFENGRIGFSEGSATPPKSIRRVKEKPVGKEELTEILVDGPDAGDDIIRPPSRGPIIESFVERVHNDKASPVFESAQASGNLFVNDLPGDNGFGSIVAVEYNGTVYIPQGSQIIVEESGIWRLTINLTGTPGDPTTGYGLYFFEQLGAYDHSQTADGVTANFSLTYTVEDSAGGRDTAAISFLITDSDPVAEDDDIVMVQNWISYGSVSDDDAIGADTPGGILEIGYGDQSATSEDTDSDGRVTLAGAYGVLVFDFDDGYYEYYSQANILEDGSDPVVDDFYYIIADSDGDQDMAHLRFEIFPDDVPPDEGPILNPGPEDGGARTDGVTYVWEDVSYIDGDLDNNVDGAKVIKGFMPEIDRLDVDGLLASLGYDDVVSAGDVFRLSGTDGGIDLQIDLGTGWQTFITVSNSPPLTLKEVEAALVD